MNEDTPENIDCGNCPAPKLWKCNQEAWELYSLISNQFCYDFHALPLVFDIYRPKWTRDEAILMLEKLVLIHQEMTKREEKEGEEGLEQDA